MFQVQSGILLEYCCVVIWIEVNVKGEVDVLCVVSKIFVDKLVIFEVKFLDVYFGVVVVFGNNIWCVLSGGVGVEELKDFLGYGKGFVLIIQFDVLIYIFFLCYDVNFFVVQVVMEVFGDCIEVKEEIYGFCWVEECDLSGFVDGIENLVGEEMCCEVVVIKDGVDVGGSYVFVQCWEYNLKQFNWMSVYDQEMMIGCIKEVNEEIDGDECLEIFYFICVDLKEDGKGLKIVCQSLLYGIVSGIYGLYFCVYCVCLYNIEQ